MTTKSHEAPHRFFNAMVLMGGSLALGCGGATADAGATGGAGSQGTGTGGVGSGGSGAGGTGGASQPKAAASGGSSGSSSMQTTGGAPLIATGGAAGSPVDAPTFDLSACQPSQWVCPAPRCSYDGEGVRVPADCRCDPTLPVDVVCGPHEVLACLHGTTDANGLAIREVDFSCRCVPAGTSCDACAELFGGSNARLDCDEARFETGQIICGCAVVYLR